MCFHSPVEAEHSLFPFLMLNCDILLLDQDTLAFEEKASAVGSTKSKNILIISITADM